MNPEYKLYRPRWYRQRLPIFWWLRRPAYTKFISRELTSVFVAYTALLLLLQVLMLLRGAEAYAAFTDWLARPWVVGLHLFVLLVLLFHSVTWLNLAPKALVLKLGRRRVPDGAVLLGHYAAWLGASALVAWLVLGR